MNRGDLAQLKFRDPVLGRQLGDKLTRVVGELGRAPVAVMHVCGSHEQAIARYGLRSAFPEQLDVVMGPGCPVCITDAPEVDEGVALALQGVTVATYGDMVRVPGTVKSLADARADGAKVEVVYGIDQAVELARSRPREEVVFFATGFETTAVATAAVVLEPGLPKNLSILSAHKYIPPAMELVAGMPGTRIEGLIAAGHAAVITGSGVFEPLVEHHGVPVVVAGFEPLDILAALVRLVELVRDETPRVENMFPRAVTYAGNRVAQEKLWEVFQPTGGRWRGVAHVPNGNLRFRERYEHLDARKRHAINLSKLWGSAPPRLLGQCICGEIMSGRKGPRDCGLFGKECVPENPVGACMVSSEGTCRIWHTSGGHLDLRGIT
jgi:hydrogenase expression/formation protein HypD